MKIFINAGHGGNDPGAVSKNGTKEADITKKVCSILAKKLINNGYNVEYFQQKTSYTDSISETASTTLMSRETVITASLYVPKMTVFQGTGGESTKAA